MINSCYYYYYNYCLVVLLLLLLLLFFRVQRLYMYLFFFSAWQSPPLACSPPSSSVAFTTILESQEQENTNLNRYVLLYCHNPHLAKSYKPMWVLEGVPIIAFMQVFAYFFDLFQFYNIISTLTVSSLKPRDLWRARRQECKPCYIFGLFNMASILLFFNFSSLTCLYCLFLSPGLAKSHSIRPRYVKSCYMSLRLRPEDFLGWNWPIKANGNRWSTIPKSLGTRLSKALFFSPHAVLFKGVLS